MKLGNLSPAPGSKRKPVRKGRGTATGQGKTAGRGQDGQNSRSGGGVRIGFEGGQMPLTRRVPKRGFSNHRYKKVYAIVNIERLNKLDLSAGSDVNMQMLKDKGVIRSSSTLLKILGEGELKTALNVTADKISASAKEKIESAGGKAEEI